MATTPPTIDAGKTPAATADDSSMLPTQSAAANLLADFIRNRYTELAADRRAEDTLWYRCGLMNLGHHWQKQTGSGDAARIVPMTSTDFAGWTAPVTDHFSKTIAANSNSLGAVLPSVTALSGNYDARSRRAAAYAQAVFDAANMESGMKILNAVLAQQSALWGITWTKDQVAFDLSVEDVPVFADGQAAPPAQTPPADPAAPAPETIDGQTGLATDAPPQPPPIPGLTPAPPNPSQPDQDDPTQVVGTERVPAPRLKTTLPSPFAVYIPRDCGDPNLTPELYERVPYRLGEAREMFPEYGTALTADGSGNDANAAYTDATSSSLAAYYQAQLMRLGGVNLTGSGNVQSSSATSVGREGSGSNKTVQYLTAIEGWVNWSCLPRDVQKAIEAEWGDTPSVVDEYAQRGMTRVSAAVAYGIYGIVWQDFLLQYSENPNHGDTPHTCFMWEKNALNPYGNFGLGRTLMPLQRQLNRLDAIHDRQLMSTGTSKLLMPESQQYDPPSGDPIDIFRYDDMGGKATPQFFPAGNAGGIPQKRAQIVQEFAVLGYTEGVASGQSPGGVDSFRGIAYLGAKAEEQRGTQRALWEQAHEARSRKILRMARRVWTEPRKIKVAGPNNRFGQELIEGADLDFETDQITIVEGSSKPKTLQEKLEALQTLAAMPGMIDPTDPDFKEFILDSIGMPEVSIENSLQYSKADRDLQQVLDGVQPVSSPAQNWQIVVRTFSQYTLTEEYEGLPPASQAGILGYLQWAQQLAAPPPMPMGPPGAPPPRPGSPPSSPTQNPSGVLSKVPGKSTSTGKAQTAAQTEGNGVASAVDASASPYHL